MQDSNRFL